MTNIGFLTARYGGGYAISIRPVGKIFYEKVYVETVRKFTDKLEKKGETN